MMRQRSEHHGGSRPLGHGGFRGHLLFVRINLSDLEPGRAEAFWSELSAWLINRGLYLGGDASTAAVYAPRRKSRSPARIRQALRRKLEASLGRPVRIEVQVLASEHATPASDLAALEAVRNAQSALAEAAGMCGEDLDRLLVGLVMRSASASKRRG